VGGGMIFNYWGGGQVFLPKNYHEISKPVLYCTKIKPQLKVEIENGRPKSLVS